MQGIIPTIHHYYGSKQPAIKAGRASKSAILCGIEIELENIKIKHIPDAWNIIEDNSLKINGKEFTLPVWNTYAKEYLEILFNALETKEHSQRCSVHVHCDVTSFTIYEIRTLILLYIIFERALFNYSGNRWDSNYCVPVNDFFTYKTKDIKLNQLELIFPKYAAFHLIPEGKLGTVEYRHMVGNTNVDYINNWIQILAELTKAAKTINLEDLVNQINDMRTVSSYWNLSKQVFKDTYQLLQYQNFQSDIEKGVLKAKLTLIED